MSRRLVAGFVLVVVVLSAVLVLVRSYTITGSLRAEQATQAKVQAELVVALVEAADRSGQAVGRDELAAYVEPTQRVTVTTAGGQVTVTGDDFDVDGAPAGAVRATAASADQAGTEVTVERTSDGWLGLLLLDLGALVTVLLLTGVAAGIGGWAVTRWLSEPFARLAAAAAMLERGRFDLDLPRTRIPELQAVSRALAASAGTLQDRLTREQQFTVHVSHVLRTPLTSLRLHLDELETHDLDPGAAAAARRCQESVQELDGVVADLVGITRRGSLMSGAEVSLEELAATVAQRWADGLDGRGRGFSAAVEGDLGLMLTPGPVEYVLDVLLELARDEDAGDRDVRLVLVGAPPVVRLEATGVCVPQAAPVPGSPPCRLDQARSLVRALGGRLEPLPGAEGVRVLLPPR